MLHQIPVRGMDRFYVRHSDADLRQQSGDGETVLAAYQCMKSSSKTGRPLNLAGRTKGIVSGPHSHTYIMPIRRLATAWYLHDRVHHHLLFMPANCLSLRSESEEESQIQSHQHDGRNASPKLGPLDSTRLSVSAVRISISTTNNLANLWKAMHDDDTRIHPFVTRSFLLSLVPGPPVLCSRSLTSPASRG